MKLRIVFYGIYTFLASSEKKKFTPSPILCKNAYLPAGPYKLNLFFRGPIYYKDVLNNSCVSILKQRLFTLGGFVRTRFAHSQEDHF